MFWRYDTAVKDPYPLNSNKTILGLPWVNQFLRPAEVGCPSTKKKKKMINNYPHPLLALVCLEISTQSFPACTMHYHFVVENWKVTARTVFK
jgi:hypothetical protein